MYIQISLLCRLLMSIHLKWNLTETDLRKCISFILVKNILDQNSNKKMFRKNFLHFVCFSNLKEMNYTEQNYSKHKRFGRSRIWNSECIFFFLRFVNRDELYWSKRFKKRNFWQNVHFKKHVLFIRCCQSRWTILRETLQKANVLVFLAFEKLLEKDLHSNAKSANAFAF